MAPGGDKGSREEDTPAYQDVERLEDQEAVEEANQASKRLASSEDGEGTKSHCCGDAVAPGQETESAEVDLAIRGIKWRYFAWGLGALVAFALLIWLLVATQTVSVPFLVAFILAYLLNPVVDRFETKGISRSFGIVILLLVVLLFMAVFIAVIGPQLYRELREVPSQLKSLALDIIPWVESRCDIALPRTIEDGLQELQRTLGALNVTDFATPFMDVAGALIGGTTSIFALIIGVVLVPVFTFFLLRDYHQIINGIKALIPYRYRPMFMARTTEIDKAMSGFIRGQLTVAGILAVMYTAGLWAVGLPMALLVGVVSGLGNMIPYLGTAIGLVLATAMAFLDWQGIWVLLMVYAVFAAVQTIESWLLTPRIVGDSVGLSPFLVIVAVLGFGELFGFVGILMAVPLAAIVKILLRVLIEEYRKSPFFTPSARGQ